MLSSLLQQARPLIQRSQQALRAHPRKVAAAVLTVVGTFGVTAFGIAPMAPDPATLPQRVLSEPLEMSGLDGQLEALAAHEFHLHQSTLTRGNDSADSLLRRLNVADPLAADFLRNDPLARLLVDGHSGKMVQVRAGADGVLLDLVGRFPALDEAQLHSHFSRLKVERVAGRFVSSLESVPLQRQLRIGSATVSRTLWGAVDEARLPESIATQMIEIFSNDLDFHRQLRKGDKFRVVFERLLADGQPIAWDDATGRVIAAEYTNRGRRYSAIWFEDPDTGRGDYFTLDGKSRRAAFLPAPLAFSRITSGFAMRLHPILNTLRAHKGVDYAAPRGTPIVSVAEGVVRFAGRQSGYGNVVEVEHRGERKTLYAHLDSIQVKQGDKLAQGAVLGTVGSTGWATGPHLHFEFHVKGEVRDPLELPTGSESLQIAREDRAEFRRVAAVVKQQLATADSLTQFRGDAE